MIIKGIRIGVIVVLFMNAVFNSFAGNSEQEKLFDSDQVLKLKLVTNLEKLKTDRDESTGYIKGNVVYDDGNIVELPVEVKVRGNFRLREGNCDFPPLKLKFDKSAIDGTAFFNNRKLKLVTHCRDEVEMQNSVMREFLAYRMYNIISDISLKVRLVEITYIDESDDYSYMHYGFLIEDGDDMCKRHSMKELNVVNMFMEQLDKQEMIKMSMFQYMIGNNDWSVPKLHNVILASSSTHVPPVAVPYDFDMSSFVDPPYRSKIVGPNDVEINYKGDRVKFDELQQVVDHYLDVKNQILNLILDMPGLTIDCKQECLQQVDEFYLKLKTKTSIRHNFIRNVK